MTESSSVSSLPQQPPINLPDAEALYQRLCVLLEPIRAQQPLQVVGIASGGAWLAQRLQRQWGLPSVGILSTAMHRDDFARRGLSRTEQTSLPFTVEGAHILLLDDVLYTGRTIRAALNEIFDFGRPASVRLAVLVDRLGRELPIEASVSAQHLALLPEQSLSLLQDEAGRFSFQLQTGGEDRLSQP